MKAPDEHERALVLVLRRGDHPADAFEALLAHPDVRAFDLPAPWDFEPAGLDLLAARPRLGAIERATLRPALDGLLALATPEALEALTAREWARVPEPVRQFYLQRSAGRVLASILRLAPKSQALPAPAPFRQVQIFFARFEVEYRLDRVPGEPHDPHAPPEEGSLILYPFDVANAQARRELGLPEEGGPVLEAYAYAPGRARHRRVFEEIATGRGWEVRDAPGAGA